MMGLAILGAMFMAVGLAAAILVALTDLLEESGRE